MCAFEQELDTASDIVSELQSNSHMATPFGLSPAEEIAFNTIIQQMIGEGDGW